MSFGRFYDLTYARIEGNSIILQGIALTGLKG